MNMLQDEFLLLVCFVLVFGFLSFCLNSKHLLCLLLSLEVIIIGLFCLVVFLLCFFDSELVYSLVVLTFAACEAAVGLSVLVNIIRSHGSSHIRSLNLRRC